MPIATHVLAGDFAALVGEIATIRATIHTNSTDGGWVNDTDDEIRLGGAVLALNASGEFTVTLPTSTGTGLQYQVTAEYVNADRQRKTWQSGWFSLTADADLADKANDSTLRINTTLGDVLAGDIAALDTRVDALEAGGIGGGGGSLTVVSGGTIDLPNAAANGTLIGYRVTATTTIEGKSFTAGSYIFERDTTVTSGWTYRAIDDGLELTTGPADETAPTVGTLAGSAITETAFTLTVTGASDAVSLASAPYAFSTDNGTTWTAYQTSSTYNVTGRTASTAYQCRHRVRDAAGNVSTGTAITVTTTTAVPTTVTEDFNRADGTTLNGLTSTTGGATLISPARSTNAGNNDTNATTVGNKVTVPAGGDIDGRNIAVLTAQQNYEVSIDYVLATAGAGFQARVVARAAIPDDNANLTNSVILIVKGDGSLAWESAGVSGLQTLAASGVPTSGRLTLRVVDTTFSALVDGVQVGSSWTNAKDGDYAVAGVYNVGSSMDNFEVKYL